MGLLRPATPGFLVTLIATGLLAVVSFNVPFLKSIFFLKAAVNSGNVNEEIIFGTLGYCLTVSGTQTCSKPSVGYQLDVNALLGDKTILQIPQVVVKWVTYALVLHLVALVLAGISAVFGLLAHVREMSMTYCSTCVSGFAAAVALVAFIFDLVLFFLTKSRINAVDGGHATIGLSIWLTLAAWVLLFFAGCFYGLGRCCIRRRPRGPDREMGRAPDNSYAEQMRLDAVKAEADRKARQAAGKTEIGLPALQEYERQPLTSKADEHELYVEDGDHIMPYHPQVPSAGGAGVGARTAAYAQQQQPQYSGGYAQATPGTRAVDAYYNSSPAPSHPAPARQASQHTQAPSMYDPYANAPPGVAAGAGAGYLGAPSYGHQQQPSGASYGHVARGTSYHSAVSHQDPYQQQQQQHDYANLTDPFASQQPSPAGFNADSYNTTGYMYSQTSPPPSGGSNTNPYRPAQATYPPDRSYTLGGGGYGDNVVPALNSYPQYGSGSPAPSASVYTTSSAPSAAPPPHIDTAVSPTHMPSPTSPRGPRDPTPPMPAPIMESPHEEYADSPPMYDAATAQPPGQWGAKR
ncbi:pali-domain-containing protein [Polyporus arcularius HHB13444]|uniref:Pali-domain-containing protein n=1 Tax=Polyporus arcularius HHB13444 TaxID=1314778 RepID=A0A5C3PX37_9APHY|nr:pali-domain-containing protein [Polyporus arcularius HHB13444]